MNGRAYDYNLGRFLSVDPIIQFPANSQSLNPYSYLMNNPMSGTDPSGYVACSASDDSSGSCGVTWEGEGDTRSVNKTSNRTGTFNTSYSVTSMADANIVRTQTGSARQTYVVNNGGSDHSTVADSDQPNQVGSPSENGKTGEGNKRAVGSETFFALSQEEQQGYFDQLTAGTQPDSAHSYAYWDLLWDIPVLGYDAYIGVTTGDWTAFGTDAILAILPGVPAGAGALGKAAKQKGLGNPFKGKTPEQIDEMFKSKGFESRGPSPMEGKGGYVNPKNGRSYHIDPDARMYRSGRENPHVDVNRRRGYDGDLQKKKFPIGDKLYE